MFLPTGSCRIRPRAACCVLCAAVAAATGIYLRVLPQGHSLMTSYVVPRCGPVMMPSLIAACALSAHTAHTGQTTGSRFGLYFSTRMPMPALSYWAHPHARRTNCLQHCSAWMKWFRGFPPRFATYAHALGARLLLWHSCHACFRLWLSWGRPQASLNVPSPSRFTLLLVGI